MIKLLLALAIGVAIGYGYGFKDSKHHDANIVDRTVSRIEGKLGTRFSNDVDAKAREVGR